MSSINRMTPFDTILLDLLDSARLVKRLQIINGNRPELLEPALEGEMWRLSSMRNNRD